MQARLHFDSVLVVTYGRSGSTLLQGVLNSIPGVVVRGENDNFIYGFYQAYKSLTRAKVSAGTVGKNLEPTHSWYGASLVDLELFCQESSVLIKKMLLADFIDREDIWCYGFKEVRYIEIVSEFTEYLQFLEQVFPNVCFIFNTRNLDDVLRSGWWLRSNQDKARKTIESLEAAFTAFAAEHPQNCFCITYEDMVAKSDRLQAMFQFLGAAYSDERMEEVLGKRHSTITSSVELKNKFFNYAHAPRETYAGLLESVLIDQLPDEIHADRPFTIGGIAIPVNNDVAIDAIVATSDSQTVVARMGLRSPAFAKLYPQIEASSSARFRLVDLVVKEPETIRVIAKLSSGEDLEIARLNITLGQV